MCTQECFNGQRHLFTWKIGLHTIFKSSVESAGEYFSVLFLQHNNQAIANLCIASLFPKRFYKLKAYPSQIWPCWRSSRRNLLVELVQHRGDIRHSEDFSDGVTWGWLAQNLQLICYSSIPLSYQRGGGGGYVGKW